MVPKKVNFSISMLQHFNAYRTLLIGNLKSTYLNYFGSDQSQLYPFKSGLRTFALNFVVVFFFSRCRNVEMAAQVNKKC